MISNNYNNNVNFTARLDLKNVAKNKRMWNEVAQMFEAKHRKHLIHLVQMTVTV